MRKLTNLIRKIIIFVLAYPLSFFFYKRKYLKGKYFNGRILGLTSLGWTWVLNDVKARLFIGENKNIPFPCSFKNTIINSQNIIFHVDDLNNFQGSDKYFQSIGQAKIIIGKGTWIANNVGLITANHDIHNLASHEKGKTILLGDNCWIGMNSVILPGVTLGSNTIVGAGSVVTKSFPEGNIIVAGNPAKVIKKID